MAIANVAGLSARIISTLEHEMADSPRADFSDVTGGSSSTAPSGTGRIVTVKEGDSLSKIAKRELGDANKWHAIFEANRDKIKDANLIHPGQVLTLPPAN
jgi:nucleoid-associated protein YgaU